MPHSALPAIVAALAVPAAAEAQQAPGRVVVQQMSIHERIIIRVPRVGRAPLPVGRTPIAPPVVWKEKKGPKCVALAEMAGMIVNQTRSIDLIMAGGKRMRARLDGDCGTLDYYSGFYIRPAADGMVCADRDAIRVRSGGSCQIEDFRTLTAGR